MIEKIDISEQIYILEFLKEYKIPEAALLNMLGVKSLNKINKKQFNNLVVVIMLIKNKRG